MSADIYDPFGSEAPMKATAVDVLRHPVIRVAFNDGVIREIDLSAYLARGRHWSALRFEEAFDDLWLRDDGRVLQWISNIDFCVDALRIEADKQYAAGRAVQQEAGA